ncbi:MAG: hypothetical protein AAF911_06455, partial [Planctomycetota bacterium]
KGRNRRFRGLRRFRNQVFDFLNLDSIGEICGYGSMPFTAHPTPATARVLRESRARSLIFQPAQEKAHGVEPWAWGSVTFVGGDL